MRVSVGLPVYDGTVQAQSVACLLAETSLAVKQGDVLTVRFLTSCTNLAIGRNQIVKEFMESGDDRLVFLDGDVTFEPGDLLRIAHHPLDFVGGAYRLKQSAERYPIQLLGHRTEPGPSGTIEVASVPTGFLALSRSVFETFREKHPSREYNINGQRRYCYFQMPYADGALYTEDAYFCKEWRSIGGKIYLDPELTLTHWQGNVPYVGHIGNFYRNFKKESAA